MLKVADLQGYGEDGDPSKTEEKEEKKAVKPGRATADLG